ncbi:TPA: TolC family protein [Legionella feeleii]
MRLGLAVVFFISMFLNTALASPSFTLREALNLAYRNNPELQAEKDKACAMKGLFIQSGLFPNPQLALTAENMGGSGQYTGYESAETTLAITQPIPLGHRLHYLKQASFADYLTSLATIKVQKSVLYIAVATAYVDALYAEQWHQVTKKLIQLNEEIVSAIKRRVDAGAAPELDLRLAEVRLGKALIQEKAAAQMALTSRANLARLVGNELRIDSPLSDKELKHTIWHWPNLLKKLNQSPQIIATAVQIRAKRAGIVAAKKSVWPDLNIQVGARHFSDDGSNAAVVSASSQLPLYNRNQGNILSAEAGLTQVIHQYQGVRLEVRKNLYIAFLQAEQSRFEANLVTNSLLPLARKSIKLAQNGYGMGKFTYLQLSLALNTLYEEEQHYQQAHAEYHKALIQISGLLGLQE